MSAAQDYSSICEFKELTGSAGLNSDLIRFFDDEMPFKTVAADASEQQKAEIEKANEAVRANRRHVVLRLQEWNRDVLLNAKYLSTAVPTNCGYLLRRDHQATSKEAVNEPEKDLLHRYGVADSLALRYQSHLRTCSLCVIVVAYFAIFSLEVAHFLTAERETFARGLAQLLPASASAISEAVGWLPSLGLASFAICWIVVLFLFRLATKRDWQNRHQDYRALAEGLRVQFYWSWANLPDQAAENYLERHNGELNWIRFALSQWSRRGIVDTTQLCEDKLRIWKDNQLNYFTGVNGKPGAIERNHALAERMHSGGRMCLYLGITAGVFAAGLAAFSHAFHDEASLHTFVHQAMLVTGYCLVSAAAFYGYLERFAFADHVRLYTAMRDIFLHAQDDLEHRHRPANEIMSFLGKQALSENADWLMVHRDRHTAEARP